MNVEKQEGGMNIKTRRIMNNTRNNLTRNEVWEFIINRSRISLGLRREIDIALAFWTV